MVERSYRSDIDGIRAIAILGVVLYHAGIPFMNGGFAGVDIFFVVSGYLIGGQIATQLQTRSFSFQSFYLRRAKRILPAFFTVLVFILLIALVGLLPEEAREVARASFSALLSSSNILFWSSFSYFDSNSQLNPLLMTWSLGVEEQFYAVIPLVMVMLTSIRRRAMFLGIATICTVSFVWSLTQLNSSPGLVFFMLPARAWELGVGVALAIAELGRKWKPVPIWLTEITGTVGLGLMLAPLFLLNTSIPFPGVAAVPSVFGAAMALSVPFSWVNRCLLSIPTIRFIGRVSYSWYLWHWPLLVFVRLLYWRAAPLYASLFAIIVAFAASVLSYYLIEQPFRMSRVAPRRIVIGYSIAGFVLLTVCVTIWRTDGLPQRFPQLAIVGAKADLRTDPCLVGDEEDAPNQSAPCFNVSDLHPAIALVGDSHAAALAPVLRLKAAKEGYTFAQFTRVNCLPLIDAARFLPSAPLTAAKCIKFNEKAFEILKADEKIQIVVISGYWAAPFHRDGSHGWLAGDVLHERQMPTLVATQNLLYRALSSSIHSLQEAGKEVVVIDDAPAFEFDPLLRSRARYVPMRRALTAWLENGSAEAPDTARLGDRDNVEMSRKALTRACVDRTGVKLVDLTPNFCDKNGQCVFRGKRQQFYSDRTHLSTEGARVALSEFRFRSSVLR